MTFDEVVSFTLAYEGGYSNDPADAGGETKFGISKRAFPHLNIATLTKDDAVAIYRREYWDKHKLGAMPGPVAAAVFDWLVNGGPAVVTLQRLLRVEADGVVGPRTLAALAYGDPLKMAVNLCANRILYLSGLDGWRRYGKGWTMRCVALARVV